MLTDDELKQLREATPEDDVMVFNSHLIHRLLDEIDRLKKEAGCHKCSSCNTTTADAYGTQLMVETSELRDEIDRLKKELEKRDEDYCDDCAGYRGDDVYWCSC